jgi:hypothetical protein
MEIIFELLLEFVLHFVVQFLGEVLLDAGFESLAKTLENRKTRIVVGTLVLIGGGFAGGWWWGNRFAARFGTSDVPTSLIVSVCFAVGFAILTGVSAIREFRSPDPAAAPVVVEMWSLERFLPWRWPPGRLAGFALLNCAIAVGIVVGFTPEDVRLR